MYSITDKKHVRSLALKVEDTIEAAVKLLTKAGAHRSDALSSRIIRLSTKDVYLDIVRNPALLSDPTWFAHKDGNEDTRAKEKSAEFAAQNVRLDIDPSAQTPYQTDVLVQNTSSRIIAHVESIVITGPHRGGGRILPLNGDQRSVNKPNTGGARYIIARRTPKRNANEGFESKIDEPINAQMWAKRWSEVIQKYAFVSTDRRMS